MRFGIKTAPQHTTWSDMLDVWRAADDIELFESAWNFDHFYPIFSDSDGPCLEALDDARGDGAGDPAHPHRLPGDRDDLPPSGRAREHGRDDRHHLRTAGSTSASARAGTSRSATRTASRCRR